MKTPLAIILCYILVIMYGLQTTIYEHVPGKFQIFGVQSYIFGMFKHLVANQSTRKVIKIFHDGWVIGLEILFSWIFYIDYLLVHYFVLLSSQLTFWSGRNASWILKEISKLTAYIPSAYSYDFLNFS